MTNRPTAIVLGGTSPHIALIENLKKRGYYTVLVDYLDNPPAGPFANEHIQESTLDHEAVLRVASERHAALVISACVDQANLTACYVGERLGLPIPYSYDTACHVTNKGLMKQIMAANGIPTPRFHYIDHTHIPASVHLPFPVVVKPADSCGSAGVKTAYTDEELSIYLLDALRISRTNKAIYEEHLAGCEVSAYCFVQHKKAHLIMATQRFTVVDGTNQVIMCYATLAPAPLPSNVLDTLTEIGSRIADCFNLDNTPLHVQAMVTADDVNIVEFSPRVGGGMSYKTILENTGFDIIDATVNSYLNAPTTLAVSPPHMFSLVHLVYAHPGIFKSVSGDVDLVKSGIIQSFHKYKTPGMTIGRDKANSARVGAFIAHSETTDDLLSRIEIAMNTLEVYDAHDRMIMRKDIRLSAARLSS